MKPKETSEKAFPVSINTNIFKLCNRKKLFLFVCLFVYVLLPASSYCQLLSLIRFWTLQVKCQSQKKIPFDDIENDLKRWCQSKLNLVASNLLHVSTVSRYSPQIGLNLKGQRSRHHHFKFFFISNNTKMMRQKHRRCDFQLSFEGNQFCFHHLGTEDFFRQIAPLSEAQR